MGSEAREKGANAPLLPRLSDAINMISERALFALMLLMIAVTTGQVIFRFFFNALTWSEELSCFLLVLASLLGAAIAFKRGSHIAVTFLILKLPAKIQKVMAIAVNLLGVIFFVIVAYYGAVLMKAEFTQTTPAMQISMAWIYAIYPVLGAVIILHLLAAISGIVKGGRS